MSPKSKNLNRRKAVSSRPQNLLPEPRRVPSNPPTFTAGVYQMRRFRHVISAGGSVGTYSVDSATFDTDFAIPTTGFPLQIDTISAWVFSDPTTPTTTIELVDNLSSKSFSDSAQIGQPSAKASYRFPIVTRQRFLTGSSPDPLATVIFTVGAQVVIDVVVSIRVS